MLAKEGQRWGGKAAKSWEGEVREEGREERWRIEREEVREVGTGERREGIGVGGEGERREEVEAMGGGGGAELGV